VLNSMSELLAGKVQAGFGAASHWLKLFNAAYGEKLEMPVFPGSLNIALDHVSNWFEAHYKPHIIWFGREEYGGERDILLLPCELVSLDINLRNHFGLQDGDVVEMRVPTSGI